MIDKGQHLRLVIVESTTNKVIAMATDMTLHLSAQTEDSSTKDTTDTNGSWEENDVTGRQGDIQFNALIAAGTDSAAITLADVMSKFGDTAITWKIVMTSGTNNRVVGQTICSGQGKITSINPQGQNRQNATYSGTINIYGPVTVGTDVPANDD